MSNTPITDLPVIVDLLSSAEVPAVQGGVTGRTTAGAVAALALSPTPVNVADLIAAGTAGVGARAFVLDANATTFASIAAGSGANPVPVYSDGINWRIG